MDLSSWSPLIFFIEFDEQVGPNCLISVPEMDMDTHMQIAIKSITILSGEEANIPKTLIIMPFQSLEKKGLIKYVERADPTRRGGTALYSITLLFDEIDDVIFYKYITNFDPIFNECGQKLMELENQKVERGSAYLDVLNTLKTDLIDLLTNLKDQELADKKSEAFPEQEGAKPRIDFIFKVVVCGDPAVGKTSTVLRFTDNAFRRSYISTIGVNISEKLVKVDDTNINLTIWDIAGQVKFDSMRKHFYQKSEGIFLVFDLTRKKTFESIPNWHSDIIKSIKSKYGTTGFVLGNKKDLVNEREVDHEQAVNVAKELNLQYFETSALTGENVNDAFYQIAAKLLELKKLMKLQRI
jgi:small GTP-binding protein